MRVYRGAGAARARHYRARDRGVLAPQGRTPRSRVPVTLTVGWGDRQPSWSNPHGRVTGNPHGRVMVYRGAGGARAGNGRARDRGVLDAVLVAARLRQGPGVNLKNNCLAEMWSRSEEGSYSRLIDCCIIQL